MYCPFTSSLLIIRKLETKSKKIQKQKQFLLIKSLHGSVVPDFSTIGQIINKKWLGWSEPLTAVHILFCTTYTLRRRRSVVRTACPQLCSVTSILKHNLTLWHLSLYTLLLCGTHLHTHSYSVALILIYTLLLCGTHPHTHSYSVALIIIIIIWKGQQCKAERE